MMEIMGGDLALTATGLCLPDGTTITIKTGAASKGDARLVYYRKSLSSYLRQWITDAVVIERPGRFNSADAALAVGMIHGITREVLAEFKIPYAYIAPAVLKMFATGKGNADKEEMVVAANQARTRHRLPEWGDPITDHNEADAWWLRMMGRWLLGSREIGELGQLDTNGHGLRHRAVFGPWRRDGGAKWPDRLRDAASRS